MKIEVELDDVIDEAIRQSLKWHYENISTLMEKFENPHDKEYQRKLLKALKRVHNFYASPSEQLE
jgi:hypothetical protein